MVEPQLNTLPEKELDYKYFDRSLYVEIFKLITIKGRGGGRIRLGETSERVDKGRLPCRGG